MTENRTEPIDGKNQHYSISVLYNARRLGVPASTYLAMINNGEIPIEENVVEDVDDDPWRYSVNHSPE